MIEIKTEKKLFEPIDVSIRVNSLEDLESLLSRLNATISDVNASNKKKSEAYTSSNYYHCHPNSSIFQTEDVAKLAKLYELLKELY